MAKTSLMTAAGLLLSMMSSVSLFGQATFTVASSVATAADIGLTELTGQIDLTVYSGTTVAAPFSIRYSAPITNNSMQEVVVYGTGGLIPVAPHPTFDAVNNAILIDVPAGGGFGSQIRILGVRVAIPGINDNRVTAFVTGLSAAGNSILAGQNIVTVIDRFLPPFTVPLNTMFPLEFKNGVAINTQTSIYIHETYPTAFTDSVGILGQTVRTTFKIKPFPGIPQGVKLIFAPIAASAETLAVLRTKSGQAETVPRDDGSTDVEYEYVSAIYSNVTIESFRFFISIEVEPTAGSGTIKFQATLVPIGAAKPDATHPSTAIPRYLELTLPDESDLLMGTVELAYPFRVQQDATYTGIAVTNPLPYRTKISLTAYDANGLLIFGAGVTNPVSFILPRSGQLAKLATEIFGTGFNASSLGTIRLAGNTSVLAGFYLQGRESTSGLDGATADLSPKQKTFLPVVSHGGPSPATEVEFYNPGTERATATLDLYDSTGRKVSVASQEVVGGGTAVRDLREIFPQVDLASFEGGYISTLSDKPLSLKETFGNSLDFNVLPAQVPLQQERFYFAHFASGGGYETELNLINTASSVAASVTLTLMDASGSPFGIVSNAAELTIQPGAQAIRTVSALFPDLGSTLRTGYIRVDVRPISTGYYSSTPPIVGSLRFSAASGYSSAALPLVMAPMSEFVYSHVAQALGYYTGVAVLNTGSTAATVTVRAYRENGQEAGSFVTVLQPGQKIAKLLYELVPASSGQLGGYIRIHSSQPILSFSLFGTDDGLSLSAIPPQNVGQ
ncbi:MAG: hypothetical protein HXY20_04135 [Acidobacteria bacterium]|nr:hypothetical protein [Acidobacteriota bacterium]